MNARYAEALELYLFTKDETQESGWCITTFTREYYTTFPVAGAAFSKGWHMVSF